MKKFLAVLVILSVAVPAQAIGIAKQGVFSAGGIVLSTDGTFDPVHGQFDPKGQTHHADHANVFYRWCFCTAMGSQEWGG